MQHSYIGAMRFYTKNKIKGRRRTFCKRYAENIEHILLNGIQIYNMYIFTEA